METQQFKMKNYLLFVFSVWYFPPTDHTSAAPFTVTLSFSYLKVSTWINTIHLNQNRDKPLYVWTSRYIPETATATVLNIIRTFIASKLYTCAKMHTNSHMGQGRVKLKTDALRYESVLTHKKHLAVSVKLSQNKE